MRPSCFYIFGKRRSSRPAREPARRCAEALPTVREAPCRGDAFGRERQIGRAFAGGDRADPLAVEGEEFVEQPKLRCADGSFHPPDACPPRRFGHQRPLHVIEGRGVDHVVAHGEQRCIAGPADDAVAVAKKRTARTGPLGLLLRPPCRFAACRRGPFGTVAVAGNDRRRRTQASQGIGAIERHAVGRQGVRPVGIEPQRDGRAARRIAVGAQQRADFVGDAAGRQLRGTAEQRPRTVAQPRQMRRRVQRPVIDRAQPLIEIDPAGQPFAQGCQTAVDGAEVGHCAEISDRQHF